MAAADRAGAAGLRWLLLSLVVLAADQASKLYFLATVPEFTRVPVVPGFFDWTLTYNEGVAFSLFGDGANLQRFLLSAWATAG
ncbi:MAG: signal peptidase II [Pseudomonadota bacterium]